MPKMIKDGEVYDCTKRNVDTWLRVGWKFVGEDKPKSFEKPKVDENPKAKKVKNAK